MFGKENWQNWRSTDGESTPGGGLGAFEHLGASNGENSTQGRESGSDAKTTRFQRVVLECVALHPNNTYV